MRRPLFLLSFILLLLAVRANAQMFTINPDSNIILIKGIYKNYEELISNRPSNREAFIVAPFYLNKEDTSSIIGGMYRFADSLKEAEHVWGFCDGNAVFVTAAPFSSQYYWKVIGLGKYPFFIGKSKSFMTMNFNAVIAGNVFKAKPRNLTLLIITEKGKFKEPDISYMKKILAVRSGLLAEFRKVADKFEQYDNPNADVSETEEVYQEKINIMVEYLIKLNRLPQ